VDAETIAEHRAVLRQVLMARDAHVRRTGRGPRATYGVVILKGQTGFRLLTLASSIGCQYGDLPIPASSPYGALTAGMVRALSETIMYVMGSVAAMVEVPAPDADSGLPTGELHLCLMVYPHAGRPPLFNSFATTVYPEHVEHEPLVLLMPARPEGWPR
jgi:hypothetical protein